MQRAEHPPTESAVLFKANAIIAVGLSMGAAIGFITAILWWG